MLRFLRPIRTQQPHASAFAIFAINLLWFSNMFQVFITQSVLAFTVKRFTDDTRLIALATSIGFGFSFLIGPVCNYLSDRIWTRLGRRRPFVILGWTAVAIAMAVLPIMPSYGALVSLIMVYTLLGDMGTPVEPLCMEVVPPHQRARSMSTRLILIQAATLIFYQVLFPRFDAMLHVPSWVPVFAGAEITGERLIYSVASILFFAMVAFLFFGVKEEKVPTAPNIPLSELRFMPVKSTLAFLKDTFGDRRWLWIYLLYCSANAFFATWTNSPLYTLLLTDQFGFSKQDVARMGLPAQLVGATLLLPLMGWFGDKFPKISYRLLAAVGLLAFGGLFVLTTSIPNFSLHQLPEVGWLVALGALAIAGVAALYLMIARAVLAWTGQDGARVYVFIVSLGLEILQCLGSWILIRHYQKAGVQPPIVVWFLYDIGRLTLKTSADVVTMPMFFDFVPREKMGTLSSGFGFTNGFLVFALTNIVGTWIQWVSGFGPKDYASGFLLQGIVGILAFFATIMFLRNFRKGRILEYGRLGLAADEHRADTGVPVAATAA